MGLAFPVPITALYSGVLALVLVALALRIVHLRWKTSVGMATAATGPCCAPSACVAMRPSTCRSRCSAIGRRAQPWKFHVASRMRKCAGDDARSPHSGSCAFGGRVMATDRGHGRNGGRDRDASAVNIATIRAGGGIQHAVKAAMVDGMRGLGAHDRLGAVATEMSAAATWAGRWRRGDAIADPDGPANSCLRTRDLRPSPRHRRWRRRCGQSACHRAKLQRVGGRGVQLLARLSARW